MTREDRKLFESIFTDAHLIDLDFSEWDRLIRICVVGVDLEAHAGRLPVFIVDFLDAERFHFDFENQKTKISCNEGRYFQWNIDDFRIESKNSDRRTYISLSGPSSSPLLRIECRGVEIREMDTSALDVLFPGWNAPFSPLARPGLEKMWRRQVESKKRKSRRIQSKGKK